jgi:hypothetical protein
LLKPYFSLDNSSIIDGKKKSFHRKHFILLSYFVLEPIHKAHRRGQPRITSLFLLTEQKIAFASPAKRPEKYRSSPWHCESFWRTTVDASLFATINILSLGQVETTTWPIVPKSIGRDIQSSMEILELRPLAKIKYIMYADSARELYLAWNLAHAKTMGARGCVGPKLKKC